MSVLEALTLAVPVVAGYTTGGMSWLLAQGRRGKLVNVGNPSEIYDSLLDIFSRRNHYRNMALTTAREVREIFGPDHVLGLYERQYHQCLQAGKESNVVGNNVQQ